MATVNSKSRSWFKSQKARGVRLELNFWRDRWRKKVNGKTSYFKGDDSAEGYQQALRSFYGSLEANHPHRDTLAFYRRAQRWYERYGEPEGEKGNRRICEQVIADLEADADGALSQFPAIGFDADAGLWNERFRQLAEAGVIGKAPQTIGYHLHRFLDFKASQAQASQISPRTYQALVEKRIDFPR